jgi:hypothetical protein
MTQDHPKTGQDRSKMAFKCLFFKIPDCSKIIEKHKENQCFSAQGATENDPRSPQDRPKTTPRPPKSDSRTPKTTQERPKMKQDHPKSGQDRFYLISSSENGSKRPSGETFPSKNGKRAKWEGASQIF